MQDALLAMFVLNRGRLVGHLYLGSTLADARKSVGQTNVGHRRGLIAVAVLLGRVHVWLLTEIDLHLRKRDSPFPPILRSSGSTRPGIGNGSDDRLFWPLSTGPGNRRLGQRS